MKEIRPLDLPEFPDFEEFERFETSVSVKNSSVVKRSSCGRTASRSARHKSCSACNTSGTSTRHGSVKRAVKRRRTSAGRLTGLMLCIAVMTLSLFLLSGFTMIESRDFGSYTYYQTYTVQAGDTIYDISAKHLDTYYTSIDAYARAVKKLNGMTGFDLYTGQKLILPYH